jgi:pyruvate-formate lyase-activating enzyme
VRAEERTRPAGVAEAAALAAGEASSLSPVDEPVFEAALRSMARQEAGYLRIMRLTRSDPGFVPQERFARQCLAELRVGLQGGPIRLDRFFTWAAARAPRAKLLPVVAAEHHLARHDRRQAHRCASLALSVNQDDLHAQKLERASRPQPLPAPDPRGRFCSNPFDKLETHRGGAVYFCCPAWLPTPIGNLERQSAEEIWNSAAARDIRASILDGSYRYCSRMHCPKLTGMTLPRNQEVANPDHKAILSERRTRLDRGPKRLVLNHDRSCNLSCPSCRTRLITARKDEQERMNAFAETALLPLLEQARRVHITASGDPFGSAHFRHVIRSITRTRARFPGLRLDLQTNGLLLEASWRELDLEGMVDRIYVSIDAARPASYRIVRRGGDFTKLIANLGFLAHLRRARRVGYVRLDFVVQALNFEEMPEAVDLVRRFGFDGIKFQMIRSWNTYSPAEFAHHNIGAADHPAAQAFEAILEDPRLHLPWVEFWGFHNIARERLRTES